MIYFMEKLSYWYIEWLLISPNYSRRQKDLRVLIEGSVSWLNWEESTAFQFLDMKSDDPDFPQTIVLNGLKHACRSKATNYYTFLAYK